MQSDAVTGTTCSAVKREKGDIFWEKNNIKGGG